MVPPSLGASALGSRSRSANLACHGLQDPI